MAVRVILNYKVTERKFKSFFVVWLYYVFICTSNHMVSSVINDKFDKW